MSGRDDILQPLNLRSQKRSARRRDPVHPTLFLLAQRRARNFDHQLLIHQFLQVVVQRARTRPVTPLRLPRDLLNDPVAVKVFCCQRKKNMQRSCRERGVRLRFVLHGRISTISNRDYACKLFRKRTKPTPQRILFPSMKLLLISAMLIFNTLAHAADSTLRRLDRTTIPTVQVEALARRILTENHITGAQIAVLNDGRLVWSAAFGLRDREHQLPMQTSTTTWAASITKSVFATYVMQLVEQNQLSLDQPIARLLPQPLDSYEEYRASAADLVRDPRWSIVTPRMLLSHTSGLANFAIFEPDKKMHLHFAPGTRFAYSGEGLNLLQFVIEQQQHKPLSTLMQQALFTPLGMDHTSMVWQERLASNLADRYDPDGKFIGHTRRDHARAAGSMTTSIDDLVRFTTALLNGRVLKPASFTTMLTPVIRIDALHQFPTFEEAKGEEGPALGLAYGLGWGLLTHTHFGPAFFKEGHGDGAQNYMICFTRHRDCMILLTNSDNGELAFRPLLEGIFGDTVTPWTWEGYTSEGILASREHK